MRIISGSLKGKSIEFLKNSNTRPLKDFVKENIFNILKHSSLFKIKIENSNILDLYSGIGSFGIECVSRGAKKVTFVEKNTKASSILCQNLTKLSIKNKTKVYNNKLENFLAKSIDEKFNIFFFDPPFADNDFLQNISLIKKKKIFKRVHIVIIHRERKSKDKLENIINILNTKKYGRSKIIFGIFK